MKIYKLLEEKFDMMQPERIPSTNSSGIAVNDSTVKALESLKSTINGHLKVGSSCSCCTLGSIMCHASTCDLLQAENAVSIHNTKC